MREKSHEDYFQSAEHERRIKGAITREQARLKNFAEKEGVFQSISDAIGALTTYTSWFSQIGLKHVAISLLEAEVERLKKQP